MPSWIERMSRSTAESLEKSVVSARTTRKTVTGCFCTVPICAKIVMLFIVMSLWHQYRP